MCLSDFSQARSEGLVTEHAPKERHLEISREATSFRFVAWSEGFFCGGNSQKTAEQLVQAMKPLLDKGFKPVAKKDVGFVELGHTSLSVAAEIDTDVVGV